MPSGRPKRTKVPPPKRSLTTIAPSSKAKGEAKQNDASFDEDEYMEDAQELEVDAEVQYFEEDDSEDEYRPSPEPENSNGKRARSKEYHIEQEDDTRQQYQDYPVDEELERFDRENNLFSQSNLDNEDEFQTLTTDAFAAVQSTHPHEDLAFVESWKQIGSEHRRKQAAQRVNGEDEEGGDMEEERFQEMASALADANKKTSISNVAERWGTALHADEDADEEMDELAFEQDLRGATGFKSRKVRQNDNSGKRKRVAPKQQAVSKEAKTLLAQANMAFAEDNIAETLNKLQEVIRIEPTVRSAWGTMAICFGSLNQPDKEIQSRIMEAHLTRNALTQWITLAEQSREMGLVEETLHCLDWAIRSSQEKDRADVMDIMWDRAELLIDIDIKKAALQYLRILEFHPTHAETIRRVVPLLHQLGMADRAISVLQKCAVIDMKAYPDPRMGSIDPNAQSTYSSDHIATLVDLLILADRPQDALDTIRKGARWLQGRAEEAFWDDIQEDDREYDLERTGNHRRGDYGRRINMAPIYPLDVEFRIRLGTARARMGNVEEARFHYTIWRQSTDLDRGNIDNYATMIDEMIRLAQGLDVEENENVQVERTELLEEALQFAEKLSVQRQEFNGQDFGLDDDDVFDDFTVEQMVQDYKRVADCLMALEQYVDAVAWLEEIVNSGQQNLEAKLRLAEAYEATGKRDEALKMVSEVLRERRNQQAPNNEQDYEQDEYSQNQDDTVLQSLSLFAEASKNRVAGTSGREKERRQAFQMEQLREHETVEAFNRIKSLESSVFIDRWWHPDIPFTGDIHNQIYGNFETTTERKERFERISEWIAETEGLIRMFSDTPQLFPKDRNKRFGGMFRNQRKRTDRLDREARALLSRMGDSLIDENTIMNSIEQTHFRGIALDDWVDLTMQYAFVLTKLHQFALARKILRRITHSNVVWTIHQRRLSLSLCFASCALYAGKYQAVFSESALRYLPFIYQFHTEALRAILVVSNSSGIAGHEALQSANNIKFFLRRSRIHESLVQDARALFNKSKKRWIVRDSLFEQTGDTEAGQEEEEEEVGRIENFDQDALNNTQIEDDDLYETDSEDDDQGKAERREQANLALRSGNIFEKPTVAWEAIKDGTGIDASIHKPPTRYNPANELFYAGLLLTSSNGIPSMAYCLRTYARFPNDPLVCLACAVACLGRASNRQVDNRNQVVMQAYAFLHRYREIRKKEGQIKMTNLAHNKDANMYEAEIEYNFGRLAHQLGLNQLAVPHYNSVLRPHKDAIMSKISENEQMSIDRPFTNNQYFDQDISTFDCTAEAAFNLHLIYLTSGNPRLANAIVERYLRV